MCICMRTQCADACVRVCVCARVCLLVCAHSAANIYNSCVLVQLQLLPYANCSFDFVSLISLEWGGVGRTTVVVSVGMAYWFPR